MTFNGITLVIGTAAAVGNRRGSRSGRVTAQSLEAVVMEGGEEFEYFLHLFTYL